MENKRLSCYEICRKNIHNEKGNRKKQFGRILSFLEKSKRFVFADITPLKDFENNASDQGSKGLMLPFPVISLEVTEANYDPVYAMTGAMVVVARQIHERKLAINIFARAGTLTGWRVLLLDVFVCLNKNDRLDVSYEHAVKIDHSTMLPQFVEFNDLVCRMAVIEVMALIRFFERYPEHVTINEPVSNGEPRKPGKIIKNDSYRVLKLPTDLLKNTEHAGGTHNSPRAHERRGFWRSSKYGVRHWVNATVVNPKAEHKIDKDYVIDL